MRQKRLSRVNAVYTPRSGTTVMINYDKGRQILEVEFAGGRIYHYFDVKPQTWEEYIAEINEGRSSGVFVNTHIKPYYEFEELDG